MFPSLHPIHAYWWEYLREALIQEPWVCEGRSGEPIKCSSSNEHLKIGSRTFIWEWRINWCISGRRGRTASGWARLLTSWLTSEDVSYKYEPDQDSEKKHTVVVFDLITYAAVDVLGQCNEKIGNSISWENVPNIGAAYNLDKTPSVLSAQHTFLSPHRWPARTEHLRYQTCAPSVMDQTSIILNKT